MAEPELGTDSFFSLIARSIEIKNSVVKEDPKDAGQRKILNFGHTVGHAFEALLLPTDRPITHGEGVAAGMMVETVLSLNHNGLPQREADGILQGLHALYGQLPVSSQFIPDLLDLMSKDKKNRGGSLRFSLLKDIGECSYDVEVPREAGEEVLKEYCV
jgi:3-dehydroquinate synthase